MLCHMSKRIHISGSVRNTVGGLIGVLGDLFRSAGFMLVSKAVLAAKLLAAESRLVACTDAIERRKAPQPRYVHRDNDGIHGDGVPKFLEHCGIEENQPRVYDLHPRNSCRRIRHDVRRLGSLPEATDADQPLLAAGEIAPLVADTKPADPDADRPLLSLAQNGRSEGFSGEAFGHVRDGAGRGRSGDGPRLRGAPSAPALLLPYMRPGSFRPDAGRRRDSCGVALSHVVERVQKLRDLPVVGVHVHP